MMHILDICSYILLYLHIKNEFDYLVVYGKQMIEEQGEKWKG